MSPLKKLAFTASLLLSASLQPAIAVHNEAQDVAAIREIVEAFRTSIINKDKATFVELFFSDKPEHVTWQMVDDDARVARFKEFAPEASRVVWWPENNYLTMIDATAAADSGSLEEVFRDVTIDTDGLVGSVNFDYSILRNGEEAHWGREMWHLVNTEGGWKIISVIWSQRDPVSSALPTAQQGGNYVQDLQDSLIGFAASDFATHGPRPAGFRDVDLRYRENDHGARSYMVCGQFRLASEPEPVWTDFATIKTDPYEQWVGDSAADMCAHAIPVSPDNKDLSPELQLVLDGDAPSV